MTLEVSFGKGEDELGLMLIRPIHNIYKPIIDFLLISYIDQAMCKVSYHAYC